MNKNSIFIMYGENIFEMVTGILDSARLCDCIGDRDKKIGLKPNLAVAKEASSGATTHPEILSATIKYLNGHGFFNISIIEGSWVGDKTTRAFHRCGYEEISKEFHVELIDTQTDSYTEYDCKGLNINICDSAMEVDFMINIPVLKGHCQTLITCALKNNKGIIPDFEKRRFHTLGLDKPIAHLNSVCKNDFIIVDGICGDLDFEEGGNPVPMNRIFAAFDPVLCDSYVCELLGYSAEDVPYITMASKLGIGDCDLDGAQIIELNRPQLTTANFKSGRRVIQLSKNIEQKDACSACYASLLHALKHLSDDGSLRRLKEKICIGQGFKHQSGNIGVGDCTCNFSKTLSGCPPTANRIYNFLLDEIL